MNDYRKSPYIIFIVILFIGLVIGILYVINQNNINDNTIHSPSLEYEMNPKVYGVNEYSNVVVNDQQMSSIYLTNYLYILRTDLQKAYDMVDDDYVNDNKLTYNTFLNMVSKIDISNNSVKEFSVVDNNYYVIDKNGIEFIFIADGVMTYTVKFSQ